MFPGIIDFQEKLSLRRFDKCYKTWKKCRKISRAIRAYDFFIDFQMILLIHLAKCIWFNRRVDKYSELTNQSQIARFMLPTWDPPGSCRPPVGPKVGLVNLVIWDDCLVDVRQCDPPLHVEATDMKSYIALSYTMHAPCYRKDDIIALVNTRI